MTPRNCLAFANEKVCVQACDTEWAHIGVFVTSGDKTRTGHYHVSVPGLQRNAHELPKPGALTHVEFDAVMESRRFDVLRLLDDLNTDSTEARRH